MVTLTLPLIVSGDLVTGGLWSVFSSICHPITVMLPTRSLSADLQQILCVEIFLEVDLFINKGTASRIAWVCAMTARSQPFAPRFSGGFHQWWGSDTSGKWHRRTLRNYNRVIYAQGLRQKCTKSIQVFFVVICLF